MIKCSFFSNVFLFREKLDQCKILSRYKLVAYFLWALLVYHGSTKNKRKNYSLKEVFLCTKKFRKNKRDKPKDSKVYSCVKELFNGLTSIINVIRNMKQSFHELLLYQPCLLNFSFLPFQRESINHLSEGRNRNFNFSLLSWQSLFFFWKL